MKHRRPFFFAIVTVLCGLGVFQIFRARAVKQRAEAALTDLTQERGAVGEKGSAKGKRSLSPGALPPPSPVRPDASQLLAANPEVLALFRGAFFARFEAEYRTYFDQVALPREKIERFKARLFQDRVDQLDLRWTAELRGAKRDDPAYQALRTQQEENLRTDLQAIVGPEGYKTLEQFRRANGVRGFVDELASAMTLANRPMTLDQQDQLVQTIAEASARFQKGGNAMPWDANWDAIMAQAPTFLTDAQVAALRENGDERVRFVWKLPEFYAQHRPAAK
jgi:hypothetical protein